MVTKINSKIIHIHRSIQILIFNFFVYLYIIYVINVITVEFLIFLGIYNLEKEFVRSKKTKCAFIFCNWTIIFMAPSSIQYGVAELFFYQARLVFMQRN